MGDFGYRHFNENFQLFGSDTSTQTEKFNLYSGLAALARDCQSLAGEVSQLRNALEDIKRNLG